MTLGLAVPAWGATATPRDAADACGSAPDAGFKDVSDDNPHSPMIDCIKDYGVTSGKTADSYDPSGSLRRDQLATFLAATIEAGGKSLPTATRDYYSDDNGNPHEDNINRLAEAEIVDASDGTFGVAVIPARAEMSELTASAMSYAEVLPTGSVPNYFSDDDGMAAEDSINRLAHAGVITGKTSSTFAPDQTLRRDQMATFLARGIDLIQDGGSLPEGDSSGGTAGDLLAFFAKPDGENDYEIYLIKSDGTGLVRVTTDSADQIGAPSWSPDGRRFVFDDGTHIYVADAQDPTPRRLVQGSSPVWSPTGDLIAFEGGSDGIHVVRPDGSGLRQLSSRGLAPAWAPDGSAIAYHDIIGDDFDIIVVATDGSGAVNITPFAEDQTKASWSPSGRYIAYSHREGYDWAATDIYVADIVAGTYTNVSNNPYEDRLPPSSSANGQAWSPETDELLIGRKTGDDLFSSMELYRVRADGSGLTRIKDYGLGAAWSPDGERIVYHAGGYVYVTAPDGSGATAITSRSLRAYDASWQP